MKFLTAQRTHVKNIGFTLIELLVVIGIISILVSALTLNFGAARGSAKNKALQADLKETQLSLTLYKSQNGQYPATLSALVPQYTDSIPVNADSSNPSCNILYSITPDFSAYKLAAINCYAGATSATDGIQPDTDFSRCPSSCSLCGSTLYNSTFEASPAFYESMAVYSNGAECN